MKFASNQAPPPGVVVQADSFDAIEQLSRSEINKGIVWDRGTHPLEREMEAWVSEHRGSVFAKVVSVGADGEEGGGTACGSSCCHDGDDQHGHGHGHGHWHGHDHGHDHDTTEESAAADAVAKIKEACASLVLKLPPSVQDTVREDAVSLAEMMLRFCPEHAKDNPYHLTMQIEVVGRNSCSRWHQDNYVGRSLITYVGPGTWLADDASVCYDQFKLTRGQSYLASDQKIVPRFEEVHQTPSNSVVFMKGSTWLGLQDKGYFPGREGLTHKSPNVARDLSGNPVRLRLLLKVDLAQAEPPWLEETYNKYKEKRRAEQAAMAKEAARMEQQVAAAKGGTGSII